jgi:hypothetical protein
MATAPALTDRTPAQRWAEVKDEEALWGDLRPELLAAVRTILEATTEDELNALILAGELHDSGARRRRSCVEAGWLTCGHLEQSEGRALRVCRRSRTGRPGSHAAAASPARRPRARPGRRASTSATPK